MTTDLARERRIRGNMDELRRLLNGNPERAERLCAWLAEKGDDMNETAITLRLPADLLEKADELVEVIGASGDFAAVRVTRSTVIRLALIRGLAALQDEFGDDGTPRAASKKPRGSERAK